MNSAESLVAQILGLSGGGDDSTRLHNLLKQSEELLRQSESTRLAAFLAELNPSEHSLGYLYILEACTSAPISKEQADESVLSIARFLNDCSAEQIRLAPEKFIPVCKRFKDLVMLLEAPIRGIAPLLTAARKLQSSSEHLTTLHPDFLLLCLLAKCYKTGLCILEDDISKVDQPRDFFLYCYYGFPKYTSSVAQRNLKNLSQPYIELANCYGNGKISQLKEYVHANREKFEIDHNLGLVNQVVSSMYKRNIQRLTQTYLTLSLEDIANTVQLNSPKEAEMHVLQMIKDGEIYAKINQKDGMVRFLEDPEQYKTCEMIERIDTSIQRIMTLSKKLTAMDELISCDPQYLGKVGRERQRFDFDDFDPVPQKFNM